MSELTYMELWDTQLVSEKTSHNIYVYHNICVYYVYVCMHTHAHTHWYRSVQKKSHEIEHMTKKHEKVLPNLWLSKYKVNEYVTIIFVLFGHWE